MKKKNQDQKWSLDRKMYEIARKVEYICDQLQAT
jgi:hypothetical protein